MPQILEELGKIAETLEQIAERGQQDEIEDPLERLKQAAEDIGDAWSGSWTGYHANVYYRGLQPPPPGAYFRTAFTMATSGDWEEFDPRDIAAEIRARAGNPDIAIAKSHDTEARREFNRRQLDLLSIIDIELATTNSSFLLSLKEEVEKLSVVTEDGVIQVFRPQRTISRDSRAAYQGTWVPPHMSVLAEVVAIQHTTGIAIKLAEFTRQVASHVARQRQVERTGETLQSRVFIGHGHSLVWRELKDFIEDKLGLPVDEFNRTPSAGVSITDRLSEMMDSSMVAFLVMTGEDEQSTGELRPRENVVHEAGLFQGRLGLRRAIVLLEDGCSKFSNNAGLVHINFPKGNIRATLQDVREVLEREGIIGKGVGP